MTDMFYPIYPQGLYNAIARCGEKCEGNGMCRWPGDAWQTCSTSSTTQGLYNAIGRCGEKCEGSGMCGVARGVHDGHVFSLLPIGAIQCHS